MKNLIAPIALTTLTGFVAVAGVACSSDADPGQGLAGGATGKGGTVGVGGGVGAMGGSFNGSGGSGATGTGGGIAVGGGSSGGASGSSGTLGSGGACVGETKTGQKGAGAVVLFLIDTSLSMGDAPGGMMGGRGMMGGGMTKMASTQQALNSAFPQLSSSLNVGLIFYPQEPTTAMAADSMDTTFCIDKTVDVPIAPLDATQLTTLTTQVTAATPDGSTPTHDAFAFAADTLRTTTAQGDKYIVLITDGEPSYNLNCVGTGLPGQMLDNQPLIDAVGAAYTTDGIKTFVVGSPGSENARSSLSAMARVGGTGTTGCMDTGMPYCHFDMTQAGANFATALSMALGQITAQIPVDCSFDLPRPPSGMTLDLNQVDITVTNDDGSMNAIGRDPGGDCATDGWVYVGEPPTGVKLCGALCDSVNAQSAPSVQVKYGCGQRVNDPR